MQKCKKCKGVFLSRQKFECPVKHCLSTNLGCARHSSRLKSWLCPRWHEKCFFIAVPAVISIAGTPLRHLYGGAVPSVLRRHGNYAIRKFLSSLGNFHVVQCWRRLGITQASLVLLSPCATFPSRIPFRYAENVPTEPKGATPWRTPERLIEKPCAPIVPQHNHACP